MLAMFLFFRRCITTDTITKNRFISDAGNGVVVSSNGNFKLSFFSPGKSPNRYVGILFDKIPQQTVVWVANTDNPLKNATGVFKITDDGNIAVFDSVNERLPLWSSNATTANSTAKLLDSGNLVLISTNGLVVWQSFDYPTDTALPGMKLGLDKRTGLNRILTSWKSEDDPAQGEFSFRLDLRGLPQFFLYKGFAANWRAGPWNGRTLSGVPTLVCTTEVEDLCKFSFVNNRDEGRF
ncbi:hypothetical protein F0562_014162 [Nyssa sinensis]|uniref:Bulb-type lectin domain-containing protein n=1 Tax=Nyssa sinensis TaxID=561372 RepID=A0A5J4ZQE3_9ASTE|nr:hypothetical protein F0562_014162 [Nyssa sinensis]